MPLRGALLAALVLSPALAVAQGDTSGDAATEGEAGKTDPKADPKAAEKKPAPDPRAPLTPPTEATPQIVKMERIAAKGFYTEAGLGAVGHIGRARRHAALGPNFTLRLGYDIFSWFSFGIHLATSSHEATVPPPPEEEWYQLYRGFADGRLGGRIGRIAFFVEGGAGAAYISSNILQKVGLLDPGERFSLAFTAGAGVEYQLENRHYAFGFAGDWWLLPQFGPTQAVEARFYLRYTYGGG